MTTWTIFRVLGLESYHYCDAQDNNDWMDYRAVREWNQVEKDAKEKDKLSAGATVIRSGLEMNHGMNMDIGKLSPARGGRPGEDDRK